MSRSTSVALGFVLLLSASAHASVVTMTTAAHPEASTLGLGLYLGDVDGLLIATIDPTSVTGSGVFDVNLSEPSDSGSLEILSTDLTLADIPTRTITVAGLGTIDLTITGLKLDFHSGPYNVVNNTVFNVPGQSFTVDAFGGTASLSNPTGFLASLTTGIYYDFDASPLSSTIGSPSTAFPLGTADDDSGLLASTAEVNLQRTEPLYLDLNGLHFVLTFQPDIHVAAIPEASPVFLVSIGCLLLLTIKAAIARVRPAVRYSGSVDRGA